MTNVISIGTVTLRGENRNFEGILKFLGLVYPPFADQGKIWHAKSRPRVHASMPNYIRIGLLCHIVEGRKKTQLLPHFRL